MNKLSVVLSMMMISGVALAQGNVSNMSDNLDKNIVPAEQETRQKEEVPHNLPDHKDRNTVPAPFEERQQEEEMMGTGSGSGQGSQQGSSHKSGQGSGSGTGSQESESY